MGAILSSKITNKKLKNVEKVALDTPWKGHLCKVRKLKQEGRELPCFSSEYIQNLHMRSHACVHAHTHSNYFVKLEMGMKVNVYAIFTWRTSNIFQ